MCLPLQILKSSHCTTSFCNHWWADILSDRYHVSVCEIWKEKPAGFWVKRPGGGASFHWIGSLDVGHLNRFLALGWGIWPQLNWKVQMPGGRGGGNFRVSNWSVYKMAFRKVPRNGRATSAEWILDYQVGQLWPSIVTLVTIISIPYCSSLPFAKYINISFCFAKYDRPFFQINDYVELTWNEFTTDLTSEKRTDFWVPAFASSAATSPSSCS